MMLFKHIPAYGNVHNAIVADDNKSQFHLPNPSGKCRWFLCERIHIRSLHCIMSALTPITRSSPISTMYKLRRSLKTATLLMGCEWKERKQRKHCRTFIQDMQSIIHVHPHTENVLYTIDAYDNKPLWVGTPNSFAQSVGKVQSVFVWKNSHQISALYNVGFNSNHKIKPNFDNYRRFNKCNR